MKKKRNKIINGQISNRLKSKAAGHVHENPIKQVKGFSLNGRLRFLLIKQR